jgi:hypothetical protein
VTIEADTVEEALARLAEQVGPGAKILHANRVRRGGVAGFFAREVIELVAEITPPMTDGVDSAFARLLAAADQTDTAPLPPSPTEPEAVTVVPPPSSALVPASPHGVRWNSATLLELGLPSSIVNRLAHLDADDDLGHLVALTSILANLCGPLPEGPWRVTGAVTPRLLAEIGVEEGAGPNHLVVGDERPAQLERTPAIVSWTSDRNAAYAVGVALAGGAVLGYCMTTTFAQSDSYGAHLARVTPMDAALSIRSQMERL